MCGAKCPARHSAAAVGESEGLSNEVTPGAGDFRYEQEGMSVVPFSHARLFNHVVMVCALASLGASRRGIGAFFSSSAGLGFAALLLFMAGASLEEAGSLLKIRAGALLRLLATLALAVAVVWACASDDLTLWALMTKGVVALGLIGALLFAPRDVGILRDVRHAQRQRLLSVFPDGIELSLGEARVTIPAAAIASVALSRSEKGRGALLHLDPAALGQDALHLLGERGEREELTLVLTEHQAATDAEVLVRRLRALSNRSPSGYR